MASPLLVGAASIVGDPWLPGGDWGSMVYRTSRVGTADTPLVGTYAVKGWAHPGPFLFWASAPLYRLLGGDPRALPWTAATLNVATITAIMALAWRRRVERPGLPLATALFVTALIHGITPARLVDLWNPFLGLLPFLLVLMLAWDASQGHPRSLAFAAVPATIAIQCHVSYGALTLVVAVWLLAWVRWGDRVVPGARALAAAPAAPTGSPDADADPVAEAGPGARASSGDPAEDGREGRWSGAVRAALSPAPWPRAIRVGLLVGLVLWLPPLVDLVADTHNLVSVVGHLVRGSGEQVGLADGIGLVSRHVRPDGPWMGGSEREVYFSVQGSGPVPVVLVLGLLTGCLYAARRRRLVDAGALVTLAIVLTAGSVFAAANLVTPAFTYLTQWLKVVGVLVWFAVGWTAWRVAEPSLRRRSASGPASGAGSLRAGAVSAVAVVALAAWSWGSAASMDLPGDDEAPRVRAVMAQLVERLPRDRTYDVETTGDITANTGPTVIKEMIDAGYDVVTKDGYAGLKWGHEHRYRRDDVDEVLTVAVQHAGAWWDPFQACADDPDVRLVAAHDDLTADERASLREAKFEHLAGPLPPERQREVDALIEDSFRVGVFSGDEICGTRPRNVDP